jgi:hypothetical protein
MLAQWREYNNSVSGHSHKLIKIVPQICGVNNSCAQSFAHSRVSGELFFLAVLKLSRKVQFCPSYYGICDSHISYLLQLPFNPPTASIEPP